MKIGMNRPPGFRPPIPQPYLNRQRAAPTHGRTGVGNTSRVDTHAQTINVIEYRFSTFSVNTTGLAITAALPIAVAATFPLAKLMASYRFTANAAVIGISLTSATTNITTGLAGIFVLTDAAQAMVSIRDDINCVLSHVSFQNATAGAPVSANRTNGMVFGDNTAMKINAGTSVGIYMSADSDVTNLLAATVNLTWVPIA